jgi:hypothetical protein
MSQAINEEPQWAVVDYVSIDGHPVDFHDIQAGLGYFRQRLAEAGKDIDSISKVTLASMLEEIGDDLDALIPDENARQPQPDPVAAAREFLDSEILKARELLSLESRRAREDAVAREAFVMPDALLMGILKVCNVDNAEAFGKARQYLEEEAWIVLPAATPRCNARLRDILCRVKELLRRPKGHLLNQLMEILDYVLMWEEGTSWTRPQGDDHAAEGVLYPHISLELVPLARRRDIPDEWREPLVAAKEDVGAADTLTDEMKKALEVAAR